VNGDEYNSSFRWIKWKNVREVGQKKRDCQVIFHDGKNHGGVKKTFRSVIKKCDVIVIQKGACGHVSIDVAKE